MLALVLALSLMTGCGSTTASSTASDTTGTDSTVEPLRIGMECDYAPQNWQESTQTDTNLPIENVPGAYAEGYDVMISRLIGEALGREVVVEKLAWDGLIEALNAGQIDMIIAGMADTEARKESVAFSLTYDPTTYVIVVRSDSQYANATSFADFAGAAILGQKDTKYDEVIDQIEGVNHLTPVDSVPNMLARLDQKSVDGLVLDSSTAAAYLEVYPDFTIPELTDSFDLGFTGACIGLRLDDTETLEAVNAVIGSLTQEDFDTMKNKAIEMMPK
jgi:ABC-type amino acid transport substrate-binding protein